MKKMRFIFVEMVSGECSLITHAQNPTSYWQVTETCRFAITEKGLASTLS